MSSVDESEQAPPAARPPLRRVLERALGGRFVTGNRVDLLRNGDQIFPAMLEAIDAAQVAIEFETFVFWRGEVAQRFAQALADRARAGVRVRVLLDAVGSLPMEESLQEQMRVAGVDLRLFRPVGTWRLWRTSHRTHRKLLIVDGRVAFTGGVGVASEWEGDARHPGEWRDTHVRVEGPAIEAFRAAFLGNWMEVADDDLQHEADLDEPVAVEGGPAILPVRSTAAVAWSDIAVLLHSLIVSAERRLWIATPYFVPDERGAQLLARAAERGVDVRVLTSGEHSDSRLSLYAGRHYVQRLLDGGVRLGFYDRTMLHLKVLTVDAHTACLGSANINRRSLQKDDEFCIVVDDPATARGLDDDFEDDSRYARWPDAEAWRRRPWRERLAERLAHPLRGEL